MLDRLVIMKPLRTSRAMGALAAGVLTAFVAACSDSPAYYPGTPAEWEQDAALVDSLSYLVPADSLYWAYHASLEAPDLHAAHQTISCIRTELMLRHGMYPAGLAIDRMMDTVWSARDRERIRAHNRRAPAALVLGGGACGFPDSLWGSRPGWTAVDQVDPRHRPQYWGNNADRDQVQSRRLK